METITVKSKAKYDFLDITDQIQAIVSGSRAKSGIVLVFVPHTTAGIICNENETNLKNDILRVLKALEQNSKFFGSFKHDAEEGNAHAHIAAALSGSSRSFIIEGGKLRLGTWQSIMFLEMDGPGDREVWTQIIPHPS